jgi:hypothetical protein
MHRSGRNTDTNGDDLMIDGRAHHHVAFVEKHWQRNQSSLHEIQTPPSPLHVFIADILKFHDSNCSHTQNSVPIHKILYIVCHGQALHNPRAEAAEAAGGCSIDKFLELMRQDDALDAELTELGLQQARACHETHFQHAESLEHLVDLVVSSTLS